MRGIAIEPQPAIYSDLGFVLEREGLPEEAVELYRKSLELDPACASAHYNLGAYELRRGEYAAAERHFRAALQAKPSAAAHRGLAEALTNLGRPDEARSELEQANAQSAATTPSATE